MLPNRRIRPSWRGFQRRIGGERVCLEIEEELPRADIPLLKWAAWENDRKDVTATARPGFAVPRARDGRTFGRLRAS